MGVLLLLVALLFSSGCTGVQNPGEKPSFHLSDDGNLSLQIPPVPTSSEVVKTTPNVTIEEITFMTFSGNVSSILISPAHPVAGVVWAPGAGVPAAGHIEHLRAYGEAGYAVLVVDIRGNGGKTPGSPLNLKADYEKLSKGQWPQVYLIVSDLIDAERYLHERYGSIPVWAVGESNGGRYAAQAVAGDPNFFGYVGISTSGFDRQGDQYEGTAKSFLLSVDPEALAGRISPRPSFIFHAPQDPIIPIESGEKLATTLGNSAQFFRFNGTHGVNGEVDQMLIAQLHPDTR
ncbi:MAG: alpha/beta hydrolase [Methanobacteriota archaeon]